MSATDELRRMLDERGVEHTDFTGITEWTNGAGRICRAYTRPEPLTVDVSMTTMPPEQAIAATLGVPCETCPQMDNPDSFIRHLMGRETCELEELARDMYKAIVMMIVIPGYADSHRSELEAIDDRAHSLGVVSE